MKPFNILRNAHIAKSIAYIHAYITNITYTKKRNKRTSTKAAFEEGFCDKPATLTYFNLCCILFGSNHIETTNHLGIKVIVFTEISALKMITQTVLHWILKSSMPRPLLTQIANLGFPLNISNIRDINM